MVDNALYVVDLGKCRNEFLNKITRVALLNPLHIVFLGQKSSKVELQTALIFLVF